MSFCHASLVSRASWCLGCAITWRSTGATIVYLPTYSPELNPCEMVFGFVKNSLLHMIVEERGRSLQQDLAEHVNWH